MRWGNTETNAKPVRSAELSLLDSKNAVLVKAQTNIYGNGNLELKSIADGNYRLLVQPQSSERTRLEASAGMTCAGQALYRDLDLAVSVQNNALKTIGPTDPNDIHGSGLLSGGALSIGLKPDYWKCQSRPRKGKSPDVIIIHHAGGTEIGSAINTWVGGLGPHFVLDIDGFLVMTTQVSECAGHAGTSCWKGVIGLNETSIGIEIVHDKGPYTPQQYSRLLKLLEDLCTTYNIPKHHVIGHQDIATNSHDKQLIDPRRAVDPGPQFDWKQLNAAGFGLQLTRPAPGLGLMYDGAFANGQINKPKPPQKLSPKHGTPKAIAELQSDLDAIGFSVNSPASTTSTPRRR